MNGNEKRLWIDAHTHVDLRRPDGTLCDFKVEDILETLDASGEDLRLICSIGANGIRLAKADPEALHQANEELYQFLRPAEGRLFGSCFVRPDALAQAHADLDLYVGKRGFVQVAEVVGEYGNDLVNGIYGRMDTPEMVEITRHAAELGAPLQYHCSTNLVPNGEHVRQTLNVARQVPEAKIVIAHAIGGRNSYLHVIAAETYLAGGGDNVYLEVYDVHVREFVRDAYQHVGADRLIVGTDWATRPEPPFAQYGIVRQMMFKDRNDWSHLRGFGLSRWDNHIWLDQQYVLALDENPYPCNIGSLFGFLSEAGLSDEDAAMLASGTAIKLFNLEGRL